MKLLWRCAFGIHKWKYLDVKSWGAWSWHTWKVRRECLECGEFDSYYVTNEKTVKQLYNEIEEQD